MLWARLELGFGGLVTQQYKSVRSVRNSTVLCGTVRVLGWFNAKFNTALVRSFPPFLPLPSVPILLVWSPLVRWALFICRWLCWLPVLRPPGAACCLLLAYGRCSLVAAAGWNLGAGWNPGELLLRRTGRPQRTGEVGDCSFRSNSRGGIVTIHRVTT